MTATQPVDNTTPPRLVIVAAVNDDKILAHNLLRSPIITDMQVPLRCYRGFASAGAAYNQGMDDTDSDILIFAHQDVYFPAEWYAALLRATAKLSRSDPDWAVLGTFGLTTGGKAVGHVWSSGLGRVLGKPFADPVRAICIDELLIVVRRASGIRFDARLPGFHMYGTDIVLAAQAAGYRCYVADLPVIHNSKPVRRLKRDYVRAQAYMRRKWWDHLPVPTLVVPLTKSHWPLFKTKLKLRLRHWRGETTAVDPTTDPHRLALQTGME